MDCTGVALCCCNLFAIISIYSLKPGKLPGCFSYELPGYEARSALILITYLCANILMSSSNYVDLCVCMCVRVCVWCVCVCVLCVWCVCVCVLCVWYVSGVCVGVCVYVVCCVVHVWVYVRVWVYVCRCMYVVWWYVGMGYRYGCYVGMFGRGDQDTFH